MMIGEADALNRKNETQSSECEELRQTLDVLKAKRHKS